MKMTNSETALCMQWQGRPGWRQWQGLARQSPCERQDASLSCEACVLTVLVKSSGEMNADWYLRARQRPRVARQSF